WVGFFFPMGGIDAGELRQNLYGAALVLMAALTTALYFLIGERYTRELGSLRFAAIAMGASAVVLAVHFTLFRSWRELTALGGHDWLLLRVPGLFCTVPPAVTPDRG